MRHNLTGNGQRRSRTELSVTAMTRGLSRSIELSLTFATLRDKSACIDTPRGLLRLWRWPFWRTSKNFNEGSCFVHAKPLRFWYFWSADNFLARQQQRLGQVRLWSRNLRIEKGNSALFIVFQRFFWFRKRFEACSIAARPAPRPRGSFLCSNKELAACQLTQSAGKLHARSRVLTQSLD